MSTRKATELEIKFMSLSDRLLEDIDDIGRQHGYSREFREEVRDAFGSDLLDIYDEWVYEGQSGGVPA